MNYQKCPSNKSPFYLISHCQFLVLAKNKTTKANKKEKKKEESGKGGGKGGREGGERRKRNARYIYNFKFSSSLIKKRNMKLIVMLGFI